MQHIVLGDVSMSSLTPKYEPRRKDKTFLPRKTYFICGPVSLTFHTEPSIGASYQISVHLVTRFQRKSFLRNQPTRNKDCLCVWWD